MDTPMFVEANTEYAIQFNRGGSSQPYHTSLNRVSYPYATNIDQENIRVCSALSRDPIACIDQVTSHLKTPSNLRWPTSAQSTWTSSVQEQYTSPYNNRLVESYERDPLRDYVGTYNLEHLKKNEGLLTGETIWTRSRKR